MTECSLCGHPMVWNEALRRRWCAVYGTHPIPAEQDPYHWEEHLVVGRDMSAPLANVVDELDAMPNPQPLPGRTRLGYLTRGSGR